MRNVSETAAGRRGQVLRLRAEGLSLQKIADATGLSLGRVWQIVRGWKRTPYNPEGRRLKFLCPSCQRAFWNSAKNGPLRCPYDDCVGPDGRRSKIPRPLVRG